jgi:hypothetical protein
LTQEKIAGIGNIYADEVLFFAELLLKDLQILSPMKRFRKFIRE